jgi:hypothetical protein
MEILLSQPSILVEINRAFQIIKMNFDQINWPNEIPPLQTVCKGQRNQGMFKAD